MSTINIQILHGKICPYCGKEPRLVNSTIIYGKDYGLIYHCPPCDAYVGVHKGSTRALGRLANAELRQWKKEAHAWFDPIWKAKLNRGISKYNARTSTYRWLAEQMQLDIEFTHIGMFDLEQCKQVVDLCKKYYSQTVKK